MTDSANPLPDLPPRFQQPEGWRWHHFTTPQDRRLRFGCIAPKSGIPDAIVVGLPGLSEFSEKYFEVAHDMLDRNLSFWIMDWHAQGKSARPLKNPHKRHSIGFENDVADLHYFISEYIKHAAVHPDVGRIPLVMLAHSMGANIGLHYLRLYPNIFSCAAFTAPMLAIKALKGMPDHFRTLLTAAFSEMAGTSYVFGGTDWHHDKLATKVKTKAFHLTSDPVRAAVHETWYRRDPDLQVGDVTFGWLYQAVLSCNRLRQKDAIEGINIPCLFGLAGKDDLVDNAKARTIIERISGASTIEMTDAAHEILMERDDARNQFLNEFDKMLAINKIRDKIRPF